jgi:hypothetical protein
MNASNATNATQTRARAIVGGHASKESFFESQNRAG